MHNVVVRQDNDKRVDGIVSNSTSEINSARTVEVLLKPRDVIYICF
jgi:hypothetical protein